MGNLLEVKNLRKTYPSFALQDVSIAVPEGCIVGFIGINGAGKTTTIRSILGLTQREGGTVSIHGQDTAHNLEAFKDRLGVVLDEGSFYNDLTMAEMKSIVARAYSGWSPQTFSHYMDRFDLSPRQRISTLSRGMRMKFALALALSHEAELLIMDEPTSGLDPLIRSELLDIMREYMKRGGKGVLFSTHITSDLDKVADVLILLHKGRVLFEEEKDQLLDRHRLVKGDTTQLTDDTRKLFLRIEESGYGFTGLTASPERAKATLRDTILERPTIEDLMLAYVEGGKA